ncbi:hypothetical protein PV327_004754 [Microctonus hyperodae]|uniref:Ras-GEF domain-containing protein n=1 Tax=Microctonus hyperodae TaxID=165561 RepID=A0AA39FDF7_MICHY|nr:hypothetical protein PV327_004754 [Microctonus hyperodae]
MEKNRIEKLLLSEYEDFSDIILIESPFAETTRNGYGVREVALGLTSSKLIIATDILRSSNEFLYPSNIDPSIETLELVSIYPLEHVNLSIFCRRRRKTLKARLTDGRANYFELGGMDNRDIFWNLWCQHVQILLSQKENGSSLSEPTAASSSSTSTLYNLSSDVDQQVSGYGKIRKRCVCRLWADYHGDDGDRPSWTRKDIYMGPSYNELGPQYYLPISMQISKMDLKYLRNEVELSNYSMTPESYQNRTLDKFPIIRKKKYCNCNNDLCKILFTQESNYKRDLERSDCTDSVDDSSPIIVTNKCLLKSKWKKKYRESPRESESVKIPKLSRFGFGVEERCCAGLYLPECRGKRNSLQKVRASQTFLDPYTIIESGVAMWEQNIWQRIGQNVYNQPKNLRRYGLATAPHFLYALGPWSVENGDRVSIQSKRSLSCVNIRRRPMDVELKLPISKRQLTTSVSMISLEQGIISSSDQQGHVLLFWTPKYWYRPRNSIVAYRQLRQHLNCLRDFQQTYKEKGCRKFFSKKNQNKCYIEGNYEKIISCDKATCILNRIFLLKDGKKKKKGIDKKEKAQTNKLRSLLKMNSRITAWDLDSTTLAKQLTLIDRDLFLRIPVTEIKILIYEKSSKNAPNIYAFIAFSHRISCLITTEILGISKLSMRTRILARFINAANKCFTMGNFQSSRAIIAGLQSPAIYRLRLSWRYLKTHHSNSYRTMSKLCKIFKNPRTNVYTKAWKNAETSSSFIPYIGDILIRILGLNVNSDSLFCECPEQPIIDKSIAVKQNKSWNGGSTFLSYINEQKENSTNTNKIITNDKLSTVNSKVINYNCKRKEEMKKINKENKIKKLFTSMFIRLRYGNYTPLKSTRKTLFWAAKQLIMARKYFERWQIFVLTSKIITESQSKKESINVKKKKIEELTSWLITCQKHAQDYDFPRHTKAWEFLLKARYREERENFILSQKLEPILDSN